MSEQKYPDIRSLLLLEALDSDFVCNSSKIESISWSCEDNIVGLFSSILEFDAFEEIAELVSTLKYSLNHPQATGYKWL